MKESLTTKIKKAWNIFTSQDTLPSNNYSNSFYYKPDRTLITNRNEQSIIGSVLNRIALDISSIDIIHCKLDDKDRYESTINSSLNNCLTLSTNKDQTSRSFIRDVIMSMLDEGCVAIVPVDTIGDMMNSNSYDIQTMRVGKIRSWYPDEVSVYLYNDNTGLKEEKILPKNKIAIIENPLYSIMNEPNSTLQRLIRKLHLLDVIDEQTGSGKLDVIIQLPYIIKSEARRLQAEERRKAIEEQLSGKKYGIAYTDGTEKITQLNRPVENNLMSQIEYLTSMLYSQLGITQSILNGTADEITMLNYNTRTIEPIISELVLEMRRKFLTKTARSQKQTILYFRDQFKLISAENLAKIADTFTRNEILTANEVRQIIGRIPSQDPNADLLKNSNLNQQSNITDQTYNTEGEEPIYE